MNRALWDKIYFNAVFGGLGGLLGWLLYGTFGEKVSTQQVVFWFLTEALFNQLLGGALIGMAIGYFVVGVDAIRDRALVRFFRQASYGAIIGAVGGAVGMVLGERVQYFLVSLGGGNLLMTMLARGIGWSLLGVAIGASDGLAARSSGRFGYGIIGGACGGLVGGALFELFHYFARQSLGTTYFWNALGLVILGACIGSLAALVQAVFQPASVRVLRGWQRGREYPLEKPASLLGREEHADIALFRDMKVEKKHAWIHREDQRFFLHNHGAPPEWTLVNNRPVTQSCELFDGDSIQLGNVLLHFQLRAAAKRQSRTPAVH
jgi:hypothetical protein